MHDITGKNLQINMFFVFILRIAAVGTAGVQVPNDSAIQSTGISMMLVTSQDNNLRQILPL